MGQKVKHNQGQEKKSSEHCGILITAHAPGPSRRVVKPQHLT